MYDIVRIAPITRLALAQQKQIISLTNHDINKNDNVFVIVDYPSSHIQATSIVVKSNIDSGVESTEQGIQDYDIVRIAPITRLALAQQKQIISLTNHDIN